MCDRLQNANGEHVDTHFIDTVVKDTCNILISCAKETFGVTQRKNQTCTKLREFHKPWFTKEYKNAGQNFLKPKGCTERIEMMPSKKMCITKKKHIRNYFKKCINVHRDQTKKKLKTLRTSYPKEYWKIINSGLKKKSNVDADPERLYEFFKDLNEEKVYHIPDNVLLPEDIDSLSNLQCNETINGPITVDEIKKCVQYLKRHKSCGGDDVYNEYIKVHVI